MEEPPQEIERRLPGARVIRRRRIRKLIALPRVLGVAALFSTAYGNVGSSIYYALGVTALYALGLTPAVFIATGILFAFTALTYAEGTAAIPEAGGSSSFARHGFNELVSFIAGWALMLGYIVTISISAFSVPNYLAVFVPVLKIYPWNTIGGMVVIFGLVVINVIGVRQTALLNVSLAILDLGTQLLLVVVGAMLLVQPDLLFKNIQFGVVPTWGNLIYGMSFAMIAYTGIETVSNMAEEAARPERDVPRAIVLVFIAVLALFTGISVIAMSAMPVESYPVEQVLDAPYGELTMTSRPTYDLRFPHPEHVPTEPIISREGITPELEGAHVWTSEIVFRYINDPVLGIAHKLPTPWLRTAFEPWIGILAGTILLIATNAGIIGISRLAFSMGTYQQLPPMLSKVHRRFRTPYMAIIVFAVVGGLLIVPGDITFLAEMYVFGALLAFTLAHVSIIALRIRKPDMPRPFMIPWNLHLAGRKIPITAVVGGMGTLATWSIIAYAQPFGRTVGFIWMAVGIVAYYIYRRKLGLPLTKTAKREVQ